MGQDSDAALIEITPQRRHCVLEFLATDVELEERFPIASHDPQESLVGPHRIGHQGLGVASLAMPHPVYTDDVCQLFDALGVLLSSWGGVDADYMRVSTLARSPDAIAVATPIELRAMLT